MVNFASFEKFSKGFGTRMLQKMGYRGGGLGKDEQGMVAPIEAKLRLRKQGLGFGDQSQTRNSVSVSECVSEFVHEKIIPMPELRYDVRRVVDSEERLRQDIDRYLRRERETLVFLQREKANLQVNAAIQEKQLKNTGEIVCLLDKIHEQSLCGSLLLESLAVYFVDLHLEYPDEYKLYDLSWIACCFALPLFETVFWGWDPLQAPHQGLDVMSSWKKILTIQQEKIFNLEGEVSPYTLLINEFILPAVRLSCNNKWEPKDPEPMLQFLEAWEELLPPSSIDTVLNSIVMPILSAAVESWDPSDNAVSIHIWVHPWLPLLATKLEALYPSIISKIGNFLRTWHPSDPSAHRILSPWRTVFDEMSWERFILHSVVPKMQEFLREVDVKQDSDQFNYVMSWVPTIPMHDMVSLLESFFFIKWQQTLYQMMCCKDPDLLEVRNWYLNWTGKFWKELLSYERIRHQLMLGLKMMNRAVDGLEVVQPVSTESTSYDKSSDPGQLDSEHSAASQAPPDSNIRSPSQIDGEDEMSFKDVIETYAQHCGLLFKPKPGRMYNGLQIYGFGNVSILVDSKNEKVFARRDETWSLVSLEQLLDMHRTSLSKRRRVF